MKLKAFCLYISVVPLLRVHTHLPTFFCKENAFKMSSDFFHHLDLTVSDPAKSRPLYELFLGHVGFTLKNAGDDWAGFGLGGKRYPCITLLKAKGPNARSL